MKRNNLFLLSLMDEKPKGSVFFWGDKKQKEAKVKNLAANRIFQGM